MRGTGVSKFGSLFQAGDSLLIILLQAAQALVIANSQRSPRVGILRLRSQLKPKDTAALRGRPPLQQLARQGNLGGCVASLGTVHKRPVNAARAAEQAREKQQNRE